jgi:transcriptional regulator with GAF, ATPase, and Fis domain
VSPRTRNQEDWSREVEEILRTRSETMERVFTRVRAVAPTITTVLLTGETGTGKGVIARAIHILSGRRNMPFVSVHCGAVPDTLLESELFGHEKGSFTGAVRRKLGKFELAKGGTLFLDEIGTITPAAQIKLLQVLQDKVFQRVGGEEEIEADIRLIAATNSDLVQMQDAGSFRKDLYYRLNVFPIELPPLRERLEDLPLLISNILQSLNRAYGKNVREVHPDVMRAFANYPWPGNIRELENLIERAQILEVGEQLSPAGFPAELLASTDAVAPLPVHTDQTLAEVRQAAVAAAESRYLVELLAEHQGRIDATARAAGITTRQLHKLMTKYEIRKEQFKPPRVTTRPSRK